MSVHSQRGRRWALRGEVVAVIGFALLLSGCANEQSGGPGGGWSTMVPLPGGGAAGGGTAAVPQSAPAGAPIIDATLGDTSATQMFIHLSADSAPAGRVTFIIHNSSTTMDHELVGFLTKTMAGAYKITGFEGDPNRIDEDTAGPVVLDTGAALKPGTTKMMTVTMPVGHSALVCNLPGHYKAGMHVDFWTYPRGSTPVTATLGDTSATQMFIHLSADSAPAGRVTFIIHNSSTTMDHELVGFLTKTMAGAYKITGFEGDPNRIDEDTAGPVVLDTGAALKPGTTKMMTVTMPVGHSALVCNLPGHYKAGMHVDFWTYPRGSTPVTATLGDTSATQMFIHLSADSAPAGRVTFIIHNSSTTMDHELVGFLTKTMAGAYKITGFEGDPNRIDEDTAGPVVLDTGAALKPGTTKMMTVTMPVGHSALVCNLPGHYKAGMHVDFWTYPRGSTPVTATLGDTSATQMFIHLSADSAPAGRVTFIIHNSSTTMDHELVGFLTKTMAGAYKITGFEGDPNRIDEDTAGPVVLDTGAALKPGTTKMMTVTMPVGHSALVCNLPGHYKAGMHVDFWTYPRGSTPVTATLGDTSATQMFIHLSADSAPAGRVTFIIHNSSTTMDHELVGFLTKTMAGAYKITGFEGDPNRIDEDTAGPVVLDTGAALKPGTTKMMTVTMPVGHSALVCNLPGHYKAGMHVDFWTYPR